MSTKNLTRILSSCLRLPQPLSLYELSRELHELCPDSAILETEDWEFDLQAFAEQGRARVRLLRETHPMVRVYWSGPEEGIENTVQVAHFEVEWSEGTLQVVTVQYDDCGTKRHWILGDTEPMVRRFFAEVCRATSELTDEILVCHWGRCQRDEGLKRAIRSASFDDLILAGNLKQKLLEDFESFFASEELYRRYGIAWRRGLILIGPPGNGKTHAVKALIQHVRKPCLYVRSFKTRYGEENGVLAAFKQARKMAPCVMVLEDIDSLIDPKVRSFFLNELDGFAANRGILVVATTNYPEKLDPAIVDRPSRFDRKIAFELPKRPERMAFLVRRTEGWEVALRPSISNLETVAERCEGFSFAYLKELCTSSLMAWMQTRPESGMGAVMLGLVETLRLQMATEPHPGAKEASEDQEDEE